MIKITDDFEVQSHDYGWEIHRIIRAKKDKNVKIHRKVSHYGSWAGVCRALIEFNMRLATKDVTEIQEKMEEMVKILEAWDKA